MTDPETSKVTDYVLFVRAKIIRRHRGIDLADRSTKRNEAK